MVVLKCEAAFNRRTKRCWPKRKRITDTENPPAVSVLQAEHRKKERKSVKRDCMSTDGDDRTRHVSRIADVIKGLGGDMVGDFVHDGVICGNVGAVASIECRLSPEAAPFAPQILGIDFMVTSDMAPSSVKGGAAAAAAAVDRHRSSYRADTHGWMPLATCFYHVWIPVTANNLEGPQQQSVTLEPIHLKVVVAHKRQWRKWDHAFDIDALAVDCNSIYVRHTPFLRFVQDRMSYAVTRIREKRFCKLDVAEDAAPPPPPYASIARAVDMVRERGWHMDDLACGRSSWVVATWERMLNAPLSVRVFADHSSSGCSSPTLTQHDTCPLCQEAFAVEDVVVNLACNHNFHGCCLPKGSHNGLCSWLRINGSCPCCRIAVRP